jgi:hypothetical protein
MTKRFLVPVAYWISESGSRGAWPEIIQVTAENEHQALLRAREFLIERDKDSDDLEWDVFVWHMKAWKMDEKGRWDLDDTYGVPDEEGYIMGDPVELVSEAMVYLVPKDKGGKL